METIDYHHTVLNVTRATLFTEGESGEYTHADFSLYSGQLALVHLQNMRQSASLAVYQFLPEFEHPGDIPVVLVYDAGDSDLPAALKRSPNLDVYTGYKS
jgi:hypothetical protein